MFLDFPRNFFGERHINELLFLPKNQPWCKISAICLVFIFEINIKLFYEKNILKAKIIAFSVAFNVIRGWYFIIQKRSPGTFLSEARLIMTCFFIQRHPGHTFWLFALLENFFDQILEVFFCEGPIDTNVIFMRAFSTQNIWVNKFPDMKSCTFWNLITVFFFPYQYLSE